MGKLIYSAIASLDGYINDQRGEFDWAAPADDVHAFINDLERSVGTYLLGRRTYEVMVAWETPQTLPDQSRIMLDFAALWQAADKIVYSSMLEQASTARTRIERAFDPSAVRELKATADRDLSIGGPTLAAHAFRAGLIDECHIFVVPVIVGGGTRSLPDNVRFNLQLLEERRFESGMMYLHYRLA